MRLDLLSEMIQLQKALKSCSICQLYNSRVRDKKIISTHPRTYFFFYNNFNNLILRNLHSWEARCKDVVSRLGTFLNAK